MASRTDSKADAAAGRSTRLAAVPAHPAAPVPPGEAATPDERAATLEPTTAAVAPAVAPAAVAERVPPPAGPARSALARRLHARPPRLAVRSGPSAEGCCPPPPRPECRPWRAPWTGRCPSSPGGGTGGRRDGPRAAGASAVGPGAGVEEADSGGLDAGTDACCETGRGVGSGDRWGAGAGRPAWSGRSAAARCGAVAGVGPAAGLGGSAGLGAAAGPGAAAGMWGTAAGRGAAGRGAAGEDSPKAGGGEADDAKPGTDGMVSSSADRARALAPAGRTVLPPRGRPSGALTGAGAVPVPARSAIPVPSAAAGLVSSCPSAASGRSSGVCAGDGRADETCSAGSPESVGARSAGSSRTLAAPGRDCSGAASAVEDRSRRRGLAGASNTFTLATAASLSLPSTRPSRPGMSRDTAEHRQPVPSWEARATKSERVTR